MSQQPLSQKTIGNFRRYIKKEKLRNALLEDPKVKQYTLLNKELFEMGVDIKDELSFSYAETLGDMPFDFSGELAALFHLHLKKEERHEREKELLQLMVKDCRKWLAMLPYRDLEDLGKFDALCAGGDWAPATHPGTLSLLNRLAILRCLTIDGISYNIFPSDLVPLTNICDIPKMVRAYPREKRDLEELRYGLLNTFGVILKDEFYELFTSYATEAGYGPETIRSQVLDTLLFRLVITTESGVEYYRTNIVLSDGKLLSEIADSRTLQRDIPYRRYSLPEIRAAADHLPEDMQQAIRRWRGKGGPLKSDAVPSTDEPDPDPAKERKSTRKAEETGGNSVDLDSFVNHLYFIKPDAHLRVVTKTARLLEETGGLGMDALISQFSRELKDLPAKLGLGIGDIEYRIARDRVDGTLHGIMIRLEESIHGASPHKNNRVAKVAAIIRRTVDRAPVFGPLPFTGQSLREISLSRLLALCSCIVENLKKFRDYPGSLPSSLSGEFQEKFGQCTDKFYSDFFGHLTGKVDIATVDSDREEIISMLLQLHETAFRDEEGTEGKYLRRAISIIWSSLFANEEGDKSQ